MREIKGKRVRERERERERDRRGTKDKGVKIGQRMRKNRREVERE